MGNELIVPSPSLSTESLVPHLGDRLLEADLVTADQLENAAKYQSEQATLGKERTLGQALIDLSVIDRDSLDQVIASQLAATIQKLEKRLAALQSLNKVIQAVSVQTDLHTLYKSVHTEVTQILGNINFLIALYDKETNLITIPYMYEENAVGSVAPYPLGEGLTSILIQTRQPLMIVEDTENRTRELGALILGNPAKSWMGVPLLIGGEVIGAMIVQDLEVEKRFDDDDLNLMSTLALQVAAGLRNVRLLESIYHQAERDRRLHEISQKIHSSSDMQTILRETAQELGKYTGAHRVHISLGDRKSSQSEEVTGSDQAATRTTSKFHPGEDNS